MLIINLLPKSIPPCRLCSRRVFSTLRPKYSLLIIHKDIPLYYLKNKLRIFLSKLIYKPLFYRRLGLQINFKILNLFLLRSFAYLFFDLPKKIRMLSTKVKANSMTHLTDARYFAAWEVEWLGFQLMPGSTHYLSPQHLIAFKEWVDGVKICGEFDLVDIDEINEMIDLLDLKTVQLSVFTSLSTLKALNGRVEVLQELVIENYTDAADIEALLSENHLFVDYFILQCSKGGIHWSDLAGGVPFSIEQLKEWTSEYPILLDINLDVDVNYDELLSLFPIKGYCVSGGEEEKVGLKNFDELDDFFETIEVLV